MSRNIKLDEFADEVMSKSGRAWTRPILLSEIPVGQVRCLQMREMFKRWNDNVIYDIGGKEEQKFEEKMLEHEITCPECKELRDQYIVALVAARMEK